MSASAECSVYVIESIGGYVKIGIANDAKSRLSQIRSANPHPVKLAFVSHYKRSEAKEIEAFAHKLLADRRKSGEWFSASVGDAIDAVLSARERLGYEMMQMGNPAQDEFANLVRARMKIIRLGVADIAEITGCSRQLISNVVRGKRKASPIVKDAIERTLLAEEIRLRDYLITIHGIPKGKA